MGVSHGVQKCSLPIPSIFSYSGKRYPSFPYDYIYLCVYTKPILSEYEVRGELSARGLDYTGNVEAIRARLYASRLAGEGGPKIPAETAAPSASKARQLKNALAAKTPASSTAKIGEAIIIGAILHFHEPRQLPSCPPALLSDKKKPD